MSVILVMFSEEERLIAGIIEKEFPRIELYVTNKILQRGQFE